MLGKNNDNSVGALLNGLKPPTASSIKEKNDVVEETPVTEDVSKKEVQKVAKREAPSATSAKSSTRPKKAAKARSGRPAKDTEKKFSEMLTTYVTPEDYAKINRMAEDEGEPISKITRKIIHEYFKKK